jgi:hypothetical protein
MGVIGAGCQVYRMGDLMLTVEAALSARAGPSERHWAESSTGASVLCESRSLPCGSGRASPPVRHSAAQQIALDALTPKRSAA